MSNNGGKQNSIEVMDSILTLIIVAALICLVKYTWNGILWAFNEYINLLRVK